MFSNAYIQISTIHSTLCPHGWIFMKIAVGRSTFDDDKIDIFYCIFLRTETKLIFVIKNGIDDDEWINFYWQTDEKPITTISTSKISDENDKMRTIVVPLRGTTSAGERAFGTSTFIAWAKQQTEETLNQFIQIVYG